MLNSMGDVDKENFRTGSNGAVVSDILMEEASCLCCL